MTYAEQHGLPVQQEPVIPAITFKNSLLRWHAQQKREQAATGPAPGGATMRRTERRPGRRRIASHERDGVSTSQPI
jgi:hypothetical protein